MNYYQNMEYKYTSNTQLPSGSIKLREKNFKYVYDFSNFSTSCVIIIFILLSISINLHLVYCIGTKSHGNTEIMNLYML